MSTSTTPAVHGTVAPGFEAVRDAFSATTPYTDPGGSGLHIRRDGEVIVDLWYGHAGTAGAWQPDTPVTLMSCTKGLLAILAGLLAEEGRLDFDAPVAAYWPEYACHGKEETTVRQVFAHRAGVPAFRTPITRDQFLDWEFMTNLMARERPFWKPGTAYLYHPFTYGWIGGEIIRRAGGGIPVPTLLAQRVTGPLDAEAWIGIPDAVQPRVADLSLEQEYPPEIDPAELGEDDLALASAGWMTMGAALPARFVDPGIGFNDPQIRGGVIPAAGGIGTARAMATIYSAAVCQGEAITLLNEDILTDMRVVQSETDPAIPGPGPYPRWGTGFMLNSIVRPMLSDRSFGHDGLGGQFCFGDPAYRIGFGYLTNRLWAADIDRAVEIIAALRTVLG